MNEQQEFSILVGLKTKDGSELSNESTLDELEALLETAGGKSCGRVLQNRENPDPKTFIGSGKCQEIRLFAENMGASSIVFDNELSPAQTKNLEEEIGLPVIDRSMLIIDIFAGRAQTSEGRVQVELARLRYVLPRLSGQGVHMSRLGGGGGGGGGARRGAGETKLETDKRHIRERIDKLTKDLEHVRHTRAVQRDRRIKNNVPSVALIGYTNSGKSTILNSLCHDNIQAQNRLFDTLDPTTRRWFIGDPTDENPRIATQEVLLTDTVGFIRKLPHHLIEAFKATLEELKYASLILHIIDTSNPEWLEQSAVVEDIVTQLGATSTPCLRVYNKIDMASRDIVPEIGGIAVSAKTGEGLSVLTDAVRKKLNAAV